MSGMMTSRHSSRVPMSLRKVGNGAPYRQSACTSLANSRTNTRTRPSRDAERSCWKIYTLGTPFFLAIKDWHHASAIVLLFVLSIRSMDENTLSVLPNSMKNISVVVPTISRAVSVYYNR